MVAALQGQAVCGGAMDRAGAKGLGANTERVFSMPTTKRRGGREMGGSPTTQKVSAAAGIKRRLPNVQLGVRWTQAHTFYLYI